MKKTIFILVLVVTGCFFMLRVISWKRDYREAEQLVQLVWPLADEIKRFKMETGNIPKSLEEIDAFSIKYDFSPLAKYSPNFSTKNGDIVDISINKRFSFKIENNFTPAWGKVTNIFGGN